MVEDDSEPKVEEIVRVFLVDTGMSLEVSSSDIAECMVEYVERLPFQAIMCTLAHIRPTGKEWSSEVGDRRLVRSTWRNSLVLCLSTILEPWTVIVTLTQDSLSLASSSPTWTQLGAMGRDTITSQGRRSCQRQCGCPGRRRRSLGLFMKRLWSSILTYCDQMLSDYSSNT